MSKFNQDFIQRKIMEPSGVFSNTCSTLFFFTTFIAPQISLDKVSIEEKVVTGVH